MDPVPATGAWRPGDPPGRRRFATLFSDEPLALELGGTLGPITVAYETWGALEPGGSNAVLVCHALTGDSHVTGPAAPGHPTEGWWEGVVGPGAALDPSDWFIVCPNVIGGCQGTTGPSSIAPDGRPWGSRWPLVTIRDQARVESALADELGIQRWAAAIGGSMGGMRALEWAVGSPERVQRPIVVACGAAASADQIALGSMQAQAIGLDPRFNGGDYYDAAPGEGPHRGLGLARRLGHWSYRTAGELGARFGRDAQAGEDPADGGRYAVESYLDHHADKLVRRFDANSYLALTASMNHHDVGRGRGGTAAALAGAAPGALVVGIDSDRLYPVARQEELAAGLPDARLVVLSSLLGHDGFLVETSQMASTVAAALADVEVSRR